MKLRTRRLALSLAILLIVQAPVPAMAAEEGRVSGGEIAVTDTDGNINVYDTEDTANGSLPDNIIVENTGIDEVSADKEESNGSAGEKSPTDDFTYSENESEPPGESSAPSSDTSSVSESEPSFDEPDSKPDGEESVISPADGSPNDLEEVGQPTDEETESDKENSSENTEEDAALGGSGSLGKLDSPEEKTEIGAEDLRIYWNPGKGYKVDPSLLPQEDSDEPETDISSVPEESSSHEEDDSSEQTNSSSSTEDTSSSGSGGDISSSEDVSGEGDISSSENSSAPEDTSSSENEDGNSENTSSGEGENNGSEDDSSSGSVSSDETGENNAPDEEGNSDDSSDESGESASGDFEENGADSPDSEETENSGELPFGENEAGPEQESSSDGAESTDTEGTDAENAESAAQSESGGIELVPTVHAMESVNQLAQKTEKGFWESVGDFFLSMGRGIADFFRAIGDFIKGLFVHAKEADRVPEGDDENDGRSPLMPVETFEAAIERAEALAAELNIEMEKITVFQMNPVKLGPEETLEIDAGGAALRSWEGRSCNKDDDNPNLLFSVDGGMLSLKDVSLPDSGDISIYASSGKMKLGGNLSCGKAIVLDFSEEGEPWIELSGNFEPENDCTIQLVADEADNRLFLASAPYMSKEELEGLSFKVAMPEGDGDWTLSVRESEGQDGSVLYAVRPITSIYWNPGAGYDTQMEASGREEPVLPVLDSGIPGNAAEAGGQTAEESGKDGLIPHVYAAESESSPAKEEEKGFFQSIGDWLKGLFGFQTVHAEEISVPEGNDENDGFSPFSPVKSFEAALEQAKTAAEDLDLALDEITIFQMNPVELESGRQMLIDGQSVTLRAWEGRIDKRGILFYLNGGALTLKDISLQARAQENEGLVWAYQGKLVLENDVSSSGSFVLDFFQKEQEKDWPGAIEAEEEKNKDSQPVIILGNAFVPDENGYRIRMQEESALDLLELIQGPGLDESSLINYLQYFEMVDANSGVWRFEVREDGASSGQELYRDEEQEDTQRHSMEEANASPVLFAAPTNHSVGDRMDLPEKTETADGAGNGSLAEPSNSVKDGLQESAREEGHSASLYAVRAGGVVYWNPGLAITVAGQTYPAGNDEDFDGTTANFPKRSLNGAIEKAKSMDGAVTIICMQPVDLSDPSASEYIPFDSATQTFQYHGEDLGDKEIVISNWDVNLRPIAYVNGNSRLSAKNLTLRSATAPGGYYSGSAVLEVSEQGQVTLLEKSKVEQGYIQLDFDNSTENTGKTPPKPVLVAAKDATANVFGANINRTSLWKGTQMAAATSELISAYGGEQQAGAGLLRQITLEKANSLTVVEGGPSYVGWELVQGNNQKGPDGQPAPQSSVALNLRFALSDAIYVDSERGDDNNDGLFCNSPVKTQAMAVQRFQERFNQQVASRQEMKNQGKTLEERDEWYPLPLSIEVCSYIEVSGTENWDWSALPNFEDEEGRITELTLTPHWLDEEDLEEGAPHTDPTTMVRVVGGGSLTIGDGVIICNDEAVEDSHSFPLITVEGGALTLTGAAQITGRPADQSTLASLLGEGVHVKSGSVTLSSAYTGSITQLHRGIYLTGSGSSLTMSGGNISKMLTASPILSADGKRAYYGGGVFAENGASVVLDNMSAAIDYNTVQPGSPGSDTEMFLGAAVLVKDADFKMEQGRIGGNSFKWPASPADSYQPSYGAAVCLVDSTAVIGRQAASDNSACSITENKIDTAGTSGALPTTSYIYGNGLGALDSDVKIYHTSLTGNKINSENSDGTSVYWIGMGAAIVGGSCTVENSTFSENVGLAGTALFVDSDNALINGCAFESNKGDGNSGSSTLNSSVSVVSAAGKNSLVTGCEFKDNEFQYDGGGELVLGKPGTVTVEGDRPKPEQIYSTGVVDCRFDSASGGKHYGNSMVRLAAPGTYAADCEFAGPGDSTRLDTSLIGLGAPFVVIQDISAENLYVNTILDDGDLWGGYGDVLWTETSPGKTSFTNVRSGSVPVSTGTFIADTNGAEWIQISENTGMIAHYNLFDIDNTLVLLKGDYSSYNKGMALTRSEEIILDPTQVKAPNRILTDYLERLYVTKQGAPGDNKFSLQLSSTVATGSVIAQSGVYEPVDDYRNGTEWFVVPKLTPSGDRYVMEVDKTFQELFDPDFKDLYGDGNWADYLEFREVPVRTQVVAYPQDGRRDLALQVEGVYVNGTSGDDANDGLSPDTAVKTWEKARELLIQYSRDAGDAGFQPIIFVCGTVALDLPAGGEYTLTLPQADVPMDKYIAYEKAQGRAPEKAHVQRYNDGYALFSVKNQGTVTFENIKIDGNDPPGDEGNYNSSYVLSTPGGKIVVSDGARIDTYLYSRVFRVTDDADIVVKQSFEAGDVDEVNDERYGAQITGGIMFTTGNVISGVEHYTLEMTENAYVENSVGLFYSLLHEFTVTLKDNAILDFVGGRDSFIYGEGHMSLYSDLKVDMSGNSRITTGGTSASILLFTNPKGEDGIHIVMRDNARWENLLSPYGLQGGFTLEMYDNSVATASNQVKWYDHYSPQKAVIIMGVKGGDDAPVLSLPYTEEGETFDQHCYSWDIQMYAHSKIDTSLRLNEAASPEGGSTVFKLTMDDYSEWTNTKADAGSDVLLDLGATSEVDISLKGAAKLYGTQRILDGAMSKASIAMEGDSAIEVGESLMSLKPEEEYPAESDDALESSVTLSGNAQLLLAADSSAGGEDEEASKTPLITAQSVTLKDNAHVDAPPAPQEKVFEEGLSILANSITLGGAVQVDGSIRPGYVQIQKRDAQAGGMEYVQEEAATPIALTSAPADGKVFQLHIQEAYVGGVVVQPDGTNLMDVSQYLASFNKEASQGLAEQFPLEAKAPNIVMSRDPNVYLNYDGDDKNDGSSPTKAVRTFKRAKELLQTGDYGEGSNIVIPRTAVVYAGDELWSFDAGGTLTNQKNNVTWTPKVIPMAGREEPVKGGNSLIVAFKVGTASNPVTFQNITIDGGEEAEYNYTLLHAVDSEVILGENAVFQNVSLERFSTEYSLTMGYKQIGGHTTIDGAVFQNFGGQKADLALDISSSYIQKATESGAPAIISVTGGELNFRDGRISNNHFRVDKICTPGEKGGMPFSLISVQRSVAGATSAELDALLPQSSWNSTTSPAKVTISGGEISNNSIVGISSSDVQGTAAIVAVIDYGAEVEMRGGRISDNVLGGTDWPEASAAEAGDRISLFGTVVAGDVSSHSQEHLDPPAFTMTGGQLTDNQSPVGSAVMANRGGQVVLEGGTIQGNGNPSYSVGDGDWQSYMSPVCILSDQTDVEEKNDRIVFSGGGCELRDPIYLEEGATITVSREIRQTTRVFEVYPETTALGAVIVQPDGDNLLTAAPYLANFNIHALGRAADVGRTTKMVDTGTVPMSESSLILLFKPVFVDGDEGTDPQHIDLGTGVVTGQSGQENDLLGLDPEHPVKTFDAAKLIGQMEVLTEQHSWQEHLEHKDYYIIFATGPIYNELYEGNYTEPPGGSVDAPNTDASNMVFELESPAHVSRYTNFQIHLGNGQHNGGDQEGEKWYNHDYVFHFKNQGDNTTVTLKNLSVAGRREIETEDNSGDSLICIDTGVSALFEENVELMRNNANGQYLHNGVWVQLSDEGAGIRVNKGAKAELKDVQISGMKSTYGSAIYVEGAEENQPAGEILFSGELSIGGEVYLGGEEGKGSHIQAKSSFRPESGSVSVVMQADYTNRLVVEYVDKTTIVPSIQDYYSLPYSVTILYDIVITGADGNELRLNLRDVFYLDYEAGNDSKDGHTPETAVKTLDKLYEKLEKEVDTDTSGVMVYTLTPYPIEQGQEVTITNASYVKNELEYYYSQYEHAGVTKTIGCQVYFQRYSQPLTADGLVPPGYNKAPGQDELFVVSGELYLNGVYLDGHSESVVDDNQGLHSSAITAKAPLITVQPGGYLECDRRAVTINGQECSVGPTIFASNINTTKKQKVLENTVTSQNPNGIIEGSGAGIEILSSGSGQTEKRGKVFLQGTQFTNLKLGKVDGVDIVGGTDVYQNGELTVGLSVRFEGSVFLEGHGFKGDTAEAQAAQMSSRWLGVNQWGTPLETSFSLLLRDPYTGRRTVKYPYSKGPDGDFQEIVAADIAKYHLHEDVSRYYSLMQQNYDKGESIFDPEGEEVLILSAPTAIYLDSVNGVDDESYGYNPKYPLKTLAKAFDRINLSSSKVIYILNPVPITERTEISHEAFKEGETSIALLNSSYLEIRRYVEPDVGKNGSDPDFAVDSYEGLLFDIQEDGELFLEGNISINGHRDGIDFEYTPEEQVAAQGTKALAPLIRVGESGLLRMESGVELFGNDNTKPVGSGQTSIDGGAIYIQEGGSVYFAGGRLENNDARAVGQDGIDGSTQATGNADGVYNNGGLLVIENNPAGITENQGITLSKDAYITLEVLLEEHDVHWSVDVMDPYQGRNVALYRGYSGVDKEHSRYRLGSSVPKELFLVEAEDAPNILELQDWKVLDVSIPEEIFLVVKEVQGGKGAVSKGDPDGNKFGTPEYTITNNGNHDVRIHVTGFPLTEMQTGQNALQLAASRADLSGTDPLLYLALNKSGETAGAGNQFAALTEIPLKNLPQDGRELGVLAPAEHGSFAFTGEANEAFVSIYMDSEFPIDKETTAEQRRAYMRNKDSSTGVTSLNNARARFKLQYRIELATPRREKTISNPQKKET
ncbi:hypothetical protein [Anaerotruncus colihominis]|uniref:hypothetical protein n=1 Tax=Anaerotruncus colihominis TaxID=169435 RepID=UPI00189AE4D7|nr:hypothetical protein [Anaerotruncus colihominis]